MSKIEWISVDKELPPDDHEFYRILDSKGNEDHIYGCVIRSDYFDSLLQKDDICRVKFWEKRPHFSGIGESK